jgi:uncharacterized spore protein YtfJ
MEQIKEIMNLVGDRLAAVTRSDTVVGSPIEVGGVTIVPLSRVSVGIGAGGGVGEGEFQHSTKGPMKSGAGKGEGGGSGGAARVRPVAVAVFTAEGVEILPIAGRRGKLDKLLDNIPSLVEKVKKIEGNKE